MFAYEQAQLANGKFLLRIEDIDQGRCRPEFEQAIFDDLGWLGLQWSTPVRRQSEHFTDYIAALDTLRSMELVYPCFCTRKDILSEIQAAGGAPHGPDGLVYPGTCRNLSDDERSRKIDQGGSHAYRLDMSKSVKLAAPLTWHDETAGEIDADPERFGDVVIARKETPTSYHLAVTIDDHLQGITLVTRGRDLFEATDVHRLLQKLLNLNVPIYHHHPLVLGNDGKRLAKRNDSVSLRKLREDGATSDEIRAMISERIHD